MSPYDRHYLDHTGYGPTGMGNAPTAQEMRMQAMNRFRNDRMAMAMQYIDPYTVSGAAFMTRGNIGQDASPAELRRAMFASAGGQAALDASMLARRGGMLGYGDPVNYATNISQGIAAGGFQASQRGMVGNDRVIGQGMMSGQGNVAERVGMNFARGMMRDLYGSGVPDPGRLYGFDMQDASGVFRTLASRGAIGHVAHVQHGASANLRIAAAREAAVDPNIRAALAEISITPGSAENETAQWEKLIKGTDNEKLKKELKALSTSTDAVVISDRERERVSNIVKEVTRGMASLADIYGELSAPELQQKLEEISGMRITNREQASQARGMVNQLRGAAIVSGMDPRAFMEYSSDMQAMLQGRVMQAGGFDQRTATMSKRVTAAMHTQMISDAAVSSNIASNNVMRAREQGINVADAPTLDEIYQDKMEGRTNFLRDYQGVAVTMGGLDNLTGEARSEAERLLKDFQGTTDAGKRSEIEGQLQSLWSKAYSRDGQPVSFANAMTSRSAAAARMRAYSNPQNARQMEQMALVGRRDALNINPLVNQLGTAGAADPLQTANQMLKNVGLSGMTKLFELSGTTGVTPAEIRKMQKEQLGQAGLTGADADAFLDNFFDAEGNVKDGAKNMTRLLGEIGYEGGMAEYDQRNIGQKRLDMIGADETRSKLLDRDQGISLRGIATAMVTGKVTGLAGPEATALALQAASNTPGMKKRFANLGGKFATGINFSKGLTKEGIGKLQGILGEDKDLGRLATKMGFDSMDELIAATEADKNVLADAIGMIQTDEEFAGANLSGKVDSMSAINEDTLKEFEDSNELDLLAKRAAGAQLISESLGWKMSDRNTNRLIEDGKIRGGSFGASKFGSIDKPGIFNPRDEWNITMGQGLGRIMNVSDLIQNSRGNNLASLAAVNEDGDLMSALQGQYDELSKARDEAEGNMILRYSEGDKTQETTVEEAMQNIKMAMDRLAEATAQAKGGETIEELNATVLKVQKVEMF